MFRFLCQNAVFSGCAIISRCAILADSAVRDSNMEKKSFSFHRLFLSFSNIKKTISLQTSGYLTSAQHLEPAHI